MFVCLKCALHKSAQSRVITAVQQTISEEEVMTSTTNLQVAVNELHQRLFVPSWWRLLVA
jgi:hypothetical protein